MAGPRQRVQRGRETTARQGAQKGSRPDPVITNFNQQDWGVVENKDDRFDYHFWPEGMGHGTLSAALDRGWQIVEAPSDADPSAERVRGGRTAKPGEALRGIHGQVLCRRLKEYGDHSRARKRAFWASIEERMGHDASPDGQASLLRQFAGQAPDDPDGHFSTSIDSKVEGNNPYPVFQE